MNPAGGSRSYAATINGMRIYVEGDEQMPDISNIDSEKMISSANQLDSVVDRIQANVSKFAEAIQNLDNGWVSEVKTGFMANFQTDFEAMQEMLFQLREINDGLRDAAGDFDKTESEIITSVSSLR